MEEQGAAGLRERQVAELIEVHQFQVHQLVREPLGTTGRLLLFQLVHQLDHREEARMLGMLGDGLDAEGGGQMCLAGAGTADPDDVLRTLGEGECRERLDLALIDLGLLEVEAGLARACVVIELKVIADNLMHLTRYNAPVVVPAAHRRPTRLQGRLQGVRASLADFAGAANGVMQLTQCQRMGYSRCLQGRGYPGRRCRRLTAFPVAIS